MRRQHGAESCAGVSRHGVCLNSHRCSPSGQGAHDRQFLRGARMREVQARGFLQVHGEHGALVHQEFEGRVLSWAHAWVAPRYLRYAARTASSPMTMEREALPGLLRVRSVREPTTGTSTREPSRFTARPRAIPTYAGRLPACLYRTVGASMVLNHREGATLQRAMPPRGLWVTTSATPTRCFSGTIDARISVLTATSFPCADPACSLRRVFRQDASTMHSLSWVTPRYHAEST